jgi:integrase
MALTDVAIRNLKPSPKPSKFFDQDGLFLLVTPRGGKWWRLKYRFGGKEKLLSLGTYPEVSLKDARERRDEARRLIANGVDPSHARKIRKHHLSEQATNTFETVAREWFAKRSPNWAAGHSDKIIRRLERDIFPWLGNRPIAEIKPHELLSVLRRIEERGALETAHRALQNCSQVFRYGVAIGKAERNPTPDLRGALPPVKRTHLAAITEPVKVAQLLTAIDNYEGGLIVRSALRLLPLVFVRPGELRMAEWAEFDLEAGLWVIPAGRMKMRTDHIVPLSAQAIAVLEELHPLTGKGRYVFPGIRSHDRPMSENTINAALRYMGFDQSMMTGHGFRAIARTLLDEVLGFRVDWIEQQLAHAVKDPLGRAYNRTAHLDGRKTMMQAWANYLDALKQGARVIALQRSA